MEYMRDWVYNIISFVRASVYCVRWKIKCDDDKITRVECKFNFYFALLREKKFRLLLFQFKIKYTTLPPPPPHIFSKLNKKLYSLALNYFTCTRNIWQLHKVVRRKHVQNIYCTHNGSVNPHMLCVNIRFSFISPRVCI